MGEYHRPGLLPGYGYKGRVWVGNNLIYVMNKEERIKSGYTGKFKTTIPGENRVVTIDRDNPEEYGVLTLEEAVAVGAISLPKGMKIQRNFSDKELKEKLKKDYEEAVQD